MNNKIYIEECKYTGITGRVYTPYVLNGKWYIIPDCPIPFLSVVHLCNLSDDDALILKLKYGAAKVPD